MNSLIYNVAAVLFSIVERVLRLFAGISTVESLSSMDGRYPVRVILWYKRSQSRRESRRWMEVKRGDLWWLCCISYRYRQENEEGFIP